MCAMGFFVNHLNVFMDNWRGKKLKWSNDRRVEECEFTGNFFLDFPRVLANECTCSLLYFQLHIFFTPLLLRREDGVAYQCDGKPRISLLSLSLSRVRVCKLSTRSKIHGVTIRWVPHAHPRVLCMRIYGYMCIHMYMYIYTRRILSGKAWTAAGDTKFAMLQPFSRYKIAFARNTTFITSRIF